jgi:hypothetical protein
MNRIMIVAAQPRQTEHAETHGVDSRGVVVGVAGGADASSAIAVYVETGAQEARERLLRVPDEVDSSVDTLEGGPASERQLLMWRLAADEIRGS